MVDDCDVVAATMDRVEVASSLRAIIDDVAAMRPVTCSDVPADYAGVRPATYGAIAVYVNRRFLDIRLKVDRARDVARTLDVPLIKPNDTNAIVRIKVDRVGGPGLSPERIVELCVEAVDDRLAGPDFVPGGADSLGPAANAVRSCPVHLVEMLGGLCDQCE